MPTGPIVFAVTAGQSLAAGSTSVEDVLTNAPVYPAKALGLDFGDPFFLNKGFGETALESASATFAGFTPLREYDSETPMTSMVNRIIYEYQQHGLTAPTIAAFNTSSGGKSILTLMTKESEVFNSVAEGLGSSQIGIGDVFAVDLHADHNYAYFRKASGNASFYYGTYNAKPVMFDNYVKQLKLAYDEAVSSGYQIDSHLVVNWIQGEDDIDTPDYDYLLNKLIEKFKSEAQSIFGKSVDLVFAVSQTQGGGHVDVAIDQLNVINLRQDTILGAPQYQQRVLYPSKPLVDYDHLTPEGYFVFGQQIGANVFNALVGKENKPIEISSITATSSNQLVVKFSGLIGSLVDDQAAYKAAFSLHPPSDMGFRVYSADGYLDGNLPEISSAKVVGANTVRLDFSSSILGHYRLYLGRTDESLISQSSSSFGLAGTTLRDSAVISAMNPTDTTNKLLYKNIFDFAPVQYVDINFTQATIGQAQTPAPTPLPTPTPVTSALDKPAGNPGIHFSGTLVTEDSAQGTFIGVFTTESNSDETYTYTLVNGKGSRDNKLVQIVGDTLQVRWLIDYEHSPTLNVRVRSTDSHGHSIDKKLAIAIGDVTDTTSTQDGDFLVGSRSGDYIKGLGGDDFIKGYAGSDVLSGGLGNDWLLGGSAADKFLFNHTQTGFDQILDFSSADVIAIRGKAFGLGGHKGVLPEGFFRAIDYGDPAAADANDHFIFRQSDHTLWFDPDGNGPDQIQPLVIVNDYDVHASNILIV